MMNVHVEQQQRLNSRSPSDERTHSPDITPRSRYSTHYSSRDSSPRSKSSPRYSSQHSMFHNRQIYVPSTRNAISAERTQMGESEHLVWGKQPVYGKREGNWVLSSQQRKSRERKYTPRREKILREPVRYAYPVRSSSEGRYYELRDKEGVREAGQIQYRGGASRYVRNRSQSPHRTSVTVKQIQLEDKVIRAIQSGLEKRQRAIRLSLYQMPDPADYEYEI